MTHLASPSFPHGPAPQRRSRPLPAPLAALAITAMSATLWLGLWQAATTLL